MCQINRFKNGNSGSDWPGLRSVCARVQVFPFESLTEDEVKTRGQAVCVCVSVCVYMSVEVSFFMLRLWAKLEAATGSNTG